MRVMRGLTYLVAFTAAPLLRASAESQSAAEAKAMARAMARVRAMTMSHKTEYWGRVSVGQPAQEFAVIFDTGSGNLILPAVDCQDAACLAHERFEVAKSETGQLITHDGDKYDTDSAAVAESKSGESKHDATITFGTGQVHGAFVQDDVCFSERECVRKLGFLAADQESDQPFAQCKFDGIMGLGFADLSMGPTFNLVDMLQEQTGRGVFSVYLNDNEGSQISFGGYRKELLASPVMWADVTRQSYWQVGINGITFDNSPIGICRGCQVAVDTGTSLLAGPSDVIAQLTEKLGVADDCSNMHELPLLGFVVNMSDGSEKVLNLPAEDYVDRADGSCSVAFMTLDVPPPKGPLFIFGDPFLRRFMTVYDRKGVTGGPRVGFALAKGSGSRAGLMADVKSGGRQPAAAAVPSSSDSSDADGDADGSSMTALAIGASRSDLTGLAKASDSDETFDRMVDAWRHREVLMQTAHERGAMTTVRLRRTRK